MSNPRRTVTRWGNRSGVWLYRWSRGRLGGPGKGTTIALLTVPGRRSGLQRTVAIGLHAYGSEYLAVGTGSGSVSEPDWFQNVRATPRAVVQIRAEQYMVDVRVAGGVERDQLWKDVVLAQAPWRARYEQKSGRLTPIAVLSVVEPPTPP